MSVYTKDNIPFWTAAPIEASGLYFSHTKQQCGDINSNNKKSE